MFAVGQRVKVNDPTWYRHGEAGVVVKVNKKTIRVKMDGADHDHVVGAPQHFSRVCSCGAGQFRGCFCEGLTLSEFLASPGRRTAE